MLIEHPFEPTTIPGPWCAQCAAPRTLHRGQRKRQWDYSNNIKPRDRIIGIDGEGVGRKPHRYTYLAAADEQDKQWFVSAPERQLSTVNCLDFLLSLPSRSLVFGFSFLYDLTKICQDMDDDNLYSLFHESTRRRLIDGREDYKPVRWNGYKLNYVQRRFSVERETRSTVVWDIFAFFQSKFTTALKAWKVADEEKLTGMERMKALRSEFDKQSTAEIEAYCNDECSQLSRLGRKLLDAHDKAGLKLRAYHGAGSTASAFLKRIDIRKYRGEIQPAMRLPIACAFFGGRFENSRIGPVRRRVYNYDISSAYPYQAWALPCLQCGRWRHFDGLPPSFGNLTLIKWVDTGDIGSDAWGGLPVRLPNGWNRMSRGTIVFPLSGVGGWTWRSEFLAARRLQPEIDAYESWDYVTDCNHRPFADIPGVYRERIKLGKDAQGLVLKLGLNSIYGKLAQSVGLNPPFQSWVWAGNITSGCRAQLLDAIASASDPWDVLMVATDGVWTTEKLTLPLPRDTGTGDLEKPLGGWEEKAFDRGVFCVRPGIYFPLEPSETQMESVRARGLGRAVVYKQWDRIVDAWEGGAAEVKLGGVQRFVGAKTGFSIAKGKIKRRPIYGEWIEQVIKCSFNARPKRERRKGDRLVPWDFVDVMSEPYEKAVSNEGLLLAIAEMIAEEQPNADFTDID